MNNNRTLIYTACNKRYACFIPLFCAVALMNNKNIDIEICISVNKLTDAQEVALDYLRQQFSNAKIIIRYNMFKELDDRMIEYQGKKIYSNSARFIINPEIHDEYVYISDIDILMFDKDFQEVHLKWMKNHNTKYCNIIRPKGISLSGLHFTYYDVYFTVDFRRYDITKKDEELLMDIVSSKTQIYKEKDTIRPVHGIHMSPSRPEPKGTSAYPGWFDKGIDYETEWKTFRDSDVYREISKSFDGLLVEQINKLEKYYQNKKV